MTAGTPDSVVIATLQEQLDHQRDRNRVLQELLAKAEARADLVDRAKSYWWWGLFREYIHHLLARLEVGHHDYGDASHKRPLAAILEEQVQEALDLDGWGFIAFAIARRQGARS